MTAAQCAKYVAFARISATQARRERSELYGRMVFFAVILGVFSSLWRAVAEAGMPVAADSRSLVWYLAATEWILLSAPPIHIDIQEAIRRGDVVYRLGHPASFVVAEFATGLGVLAVRTPFLGLTACLCAFAFTGWMPPLTALLIVVPFGFVASALIMALCLGTGLLAFWLQDVAPVYWVWQKLMFVLGGLSCHSRCIRHSSSRRPSSRHFRRCSRRRRRSCWELISSRQERCSEVSSSGAA